MCIGKSKYMLVHYLKLIYFPYFDESCGHCDSKLKLVMHNKIPHTVNNSKQLHLKHA